MAEGKQLFCRVITPEGMVYDGEVKMVKVRIADGDIGILADHQPIVSTVGVRDVQITEENDERKYFATSDGFFKVSENLVQILVEEAVAADGIDTSAAEDRVEKAEQELSNLSGDDDENDRRRRELEKERAMGENLSRVATTYGN